MPSDRRVPDRVTHAAARSRRSRISNFVGGEAATNLSTVELGADRNVCVVSSVQTNLIVDVFAVTTVTVRVATGAPVVRQADLAAVRPGSDRLRDRVRRRNGDGERRDERRTPAVHIGDPVGRRRTRHVGRNRHIDLSLAHGPTRRRFDDPPGRGPELPLPLRSTGLPAARGAPTGGSGTRLVPHDLGLLPARTRPRTVRT